MIATKINYKPNVRRDCATIQQDVLLQFWVIDQNTNKLFCWPALELFCFVDGKRWGYLKTYKMQQMKVDNCKEFLSLAAFLFHCHTYRFMLLHLSDMWHFCKFLLTEHNLTNIYAWSNFILTSHVTWHDHNGVQSFLKERSYFHAPSFLRDISSFFFQFYVSEISLKRESWKLKCSSRNNFNPLCMS